MPALSGDVIAFVVVRLACFETPEKVVSGVKDTFGLSLTRQRVEAYNPERAAGARLGPQWRELFYDARRRYLKELANIPLAHKAYRLRALGRMLQRAEDVGNYALVARVLAQAAKEVGEALP